MLRLLALHAFVALTTAASDGDNPAAINDAVYYTMPKLFHLDEYDGCLAVGGLYCMGSFELTPEGGHHQLYQTMQAYSSQWVDNYNHTRLHRGLCVSKRCAAERAPIATASPDAWFASCVNSSTMSTYNLSARLYQLDYCRRGPRGSEEPLTASQRAFAGMVAVLLGLAAVCTALDITMSDSWKKNAQWALVWSVPACWRTLKARPQQSADTDLRAFDGLRVVCMMCVIIEHVVWVNTQVYVGSARYTETKRRASDVMLMTNSTLVVQIFLLMSSFLLAHKLLQQRRRKEPVAPFSTFCKTMLNRIIRISPSYFVVVWFASSWWVRLGDGPMWEPLVSAEAAICERKWWTHLLYLNNIIYADDKCLIQTWYLAADTQLYTASLLLTLGLWRWRRGAVCALAALLLSSVPLLLVMAYAWSLLPIFVLHNPELIRSAYVGEPSFNMLYQSPLGNVPGALTGLLLAHAHHALLDSGVRLNQRKWFSWVSVLATPLTVWWMASSPRLLGEGVPSRGSAAALAALEKPVFALTVSVALLGVMQDVRSPWRRWLSWRGLAAPARLSFGALLLHLPVIKVLVGTRVAPAQPDRQSMITEWFGIAVISYLCALPLALLVELPMQRLQRALTARRAPAPPAAAHSDGAEKPPKEPSTT